MRAHIVVAHPEPKSYNAHLAATGREALERRGWSVTVSDLYQMGFDPCERPEHYSAPLDRSRFDVQSEQRHASATRTIPAEVEARLTAIAAEWANTLTQVEKIPAIPFNQMAHWGSDGRITPDAPVYSPFIRRKPQLPLE